MAKKAATRRKITKTKSSNTTKETIECGLIMPISEIDGCSADHWEQVREIIEEALDSESIKTRLVSDADEVGIIQDRIVKNLYQNPVVVCDVSCKNPNVMFELGLRLAFDKPTIVIKDDETEYSFDTSPIEHIPYPRNLNYRSMVKFKKTLRQKVESTLEKAKSDPNYSTFLGSFRIKNLVGIETDEVTPSEYVLSELKDLKKIVSRISSKQSTYQHIDPKFLPKEFKPIEDEPVRMTHEIRFGNDSTFELSKEAVEKLIKWKANKPDNVFSTMTADEFDELITRL
ncbi:hypothetical protein [Gimesia maris]|uniref:RNA helicase n=1 Tax=Gimesia maris TaxID=122 RepID=A0ABX5YJ27_9PLAN|nr:hypothetical protein [Gimesia maris]EDL58271.1 hypothetical protein PM8797T_17087 [Gimesia maris DSM 8797]QEG15523.1 hypothetical protein GmarT_13640 [Gimesia maris]QGQ31178.1 RNA helicase [Gimesia maris]